MWLGIVASPFVGAFLGHNARDSGSNRSREIATILLRIDWLSGLIGALLW
jgi:hypothetical protein